MVNLAEQEHQQYYFHKTEFKECSHVHSIPQTPSTVSVSNVDANRLIHINGRLIAPTLVIHKSGGDG